jgi:tetratricopeptide (TPR) repeat protein
MDESPETSGASQVQAELDGDAFVRNGQLLKAAASYSKAIRSDPQSGSLYCKRAWILLEMNKVSKLLSDASMIVKLQPESYLGHFLKVGTNP